MTTQQTQKKPEATVKVFFDTRQQAQEMANQLRIVAALLDAGLKADLVLPEGHELFFAATPERGRRVDPFCSIHVSNVRLLERLDWDGYESIDVGELFTLYSADKKFTMPRSKRAV